ncbi:tubulin-tyrosine ligase [Wolfiporia cocos MD-104 SS10]|uniref:Tubulin-tyrosine ligase n=1 Tax=Wolfiporia cocos (strain MD-104) TaxID=742152 RepID=A0A2H3IV11_WOLCO|nr:tubulin-tyrosine ligase [Wolfiporia cocos MD-104 SS10]
MQQFTALVHWPSAPLTESLVRKSLASLEARPHIEASLSDDQLSSTQNLLQWSTYDSIDHDLTYSATSDTKRLSSCYTIRKALIRKHFLSRCIQNYITKRGDSLLKVAVPRTWDIELSFADELDEMWSDDLYDLGQELDLEDVNKWWMLKPGMADRGMGIRLFHTKDDLTKIFEDFEQNESDEETEEFEQNGSDDKTEDAAHEESATAVVTSQLRHFVIQEYLSAPLLLDPSEAPLDGSVRPPLPDLHGHKFHLRVYCVASGALQVYMYTRILALFSAVPYKPPGAASEGTSNLDINENLAAHLTNTSLQTERGEAGVRLFDELIGCHILSGEKPSSTHIEQSQARSQRPPHSMGMAMDATRIRAAKKELAATAENAQRPALTNEDVQDIQSQIANVLTETFKAALDMSVHFQPLPNAFELYGVDFLVTHNVSSPISRKFQVHLLEVNSEPAIELTGPRLTWILEDLFRAIGKVCVTPFFTSSDQRDNQTKWEVGEMREALRKCLDVEVRGAKGW